MRKKIVAGNWKMNLNKSEACSIIENTIHARYCDIYFFSSFLFLEALKSTSGIENGSIQLGAQNAFGIDAGAYTGEVSMKQLADFGVHSVLVGHSERRQYFSEDSNLLKAKIDAALKHNLTPFYCCGESLEEREKGLHKEVVSKQIEACLFHLDTESMSKVVIAYEPVWAIGTGKTASSAQAEEMHKLIRDAITEKFGSEIGEDISILYGGSCKPDNAKELFRQPNIDGGLIGGASLNADDFNSIINSF